MPGGRPGARLGPPTARSVSSSRSGSTSFRSASQARHRAQSNRAGSQALGARAGAVTPEQAADEGCDPAVIAFRQGFRQNALRSRGKIQRAMDDGAAVCVCPLLGFCPGAVRLHEKPCDFCNGDRCPTYPEGHVHRSFAGDADHANLCRVVMEFYRTIDEPDLAIREGQWK